MSQLQYLHIVEKQIDSSDVMGQFLFSTSNMKSNGGKVMRALLFVIILMMVSYVPVSTKGEERPISRDEIPTYQAVNETTKSTVLARLFQTPLHFVVNQGQFSDEVIYYAKSEGATIYCTEQGLVFGFAMECFAMERNDSVIAKDEATIESLHSKNTIITLKFSENSRVKPEAIGELAGKVNYFIGIDPTSWQTDIPTFKEVVYREVYPGIDLVYSGDLSACNAQAGQRRLKYTFYLQPHSNPDQILMIYDGIDSVWIDETTGELVIQTEWGKMRDAAPVACQEIEGVRKKVDISFRLMGEKRVSFALGDYDPNFMLTLDLGYSTYLVRSNWRKEGKNEKG